MTARPASGTSPSGKELARIISIQNRENWLIFTPEGAYDGSEGGRERVAFRMGDGLDVQPFDPLAAGKSGYFPGLLSHVCAKRYQCRRIRNDRFPRYSPRSHVRGNALRGRSASLGDFGVARRASQTAGRSTRCVPKSAEGHTTTATLQKLPASRFNSGWS